MKVTATGMSVLSARSTSPNAEPPWLAAAPRRSTSSCISSPQLILIISGSVSCWKASLAISYMKVMPFLTAAPSSSSPAATSPCDTNSSIRIRCMWSRSSCVGLPLSMPASFASTAPAAAPRAAARTAARGVALPADCDWVGAA